MVRYLVLDPSGNTGKEGDGTTGWAVFKDGELKDFGHIKAEDYSCAEEYWSAHRDLFIEFDIHTIRNDTIVLESYKLFGHKAKQQSGSELATPQLIGIIRMWCYDNAVPLVFQNPSDKVRVTDPILVHMGVLEEKNGRYYALGRSTIIHERDAIRHGIFYSRYGQK